jgi:N-acetylmuramoyl-L-alanine amidase
MCKKILLPIFLLLLIAGCAGGPGLQKHPGSFYARGRLVELGDFCQRNGLRYDYNTLDDVVQISSQKIDLKLLIASSIAYCNGRMINLKNSPVYRGGNIFIPLELEGIISSTLLPQREHFFIKTVVLDPGHGGRDPGAISPGGLKEKGVNLKVARYLKQELEQEGFRVYLTRNRDVYLTLDQRVEVARRKSADLFISIHANANNSPSIKGIEVYYLSERYFDKNKQLRKLTNHTPFNCRGKTLSKDTGRRAWDLFLTKNNRLSLRYANSLIATIRALGFSTKSPRGAPFYVLKYAYVPSILVEIGYLTNPREARLLRKKYYLQQIAKGIALSVVKFNRVYARRR